MSHKTETLKKLKHNHKYKIPREVTDEEIENLRSEYVNIVPSEINEFNDFPLSLNTLKGLGHNSYRVPTDIQQQAIGPALQGFDILGAAKTGSGKTLAFLIPLLEVLYCQKWAKEYGLGALVISPTRELALQIFETLRKVGQFHNFSAGLIIGGKDLKFERSRMDRVNIIIGTPGRLLQHMDENPLFDCANLKVLVLDEADRCLDMGFEETMNAIIENLPRKRQTMLFSATQTRSVKDLARLSLKDPKYISVHEHEKHKTPEGLVQSYIVCEQDEKMTMLWSFIKSHQKSKILVFLSTCNQVRYTHEIMKQLRPSIQLLALHGKLHQLKRIDIYNTFCTKQHAILFATDIAARGLDFPEVHWVVQLDCPEDVPTYIHRAGRTARYHKGGECLLVLRPQESKFIEYLNNSKIPISEIKVNPAKMFSPQAKIEALLAKNPPLKASAQRAFVSYAKSVFLMKDKSIFDVKSIDTEKYSRSLGLVVCPRIRFLQRMEKKNTAKTLENFQNENVTSETEDVEDNLMSKNEEAEVHLMPENKILAFHADDSGDEGNILTLKRKDHELDETLEGDLPSVIQYKSLKKKKITQVALAKRILKKKIIPNKKIIFSEEGEALVNKLREKITDAGKNYELGNTEGGINIDEAKKVMKEEDKWDRKLFREKLKAKKKEEKRKRKAKLAQKEDEVDEFEGEESGSEPDLSWLPDPDKVYKNEESDNEAELSESEYEGHNEYQSNIVNENDSPEEEIPRKRAKFKYPAESSDSDDSFSLQDEELLALKLLSSNR